LEERVVLGDLSAVRDWGYAPDYMEAMRRMLTLDEPRDFVIATGDPHSVRDVCAVAFGHVGLDWRRHVEAADDFKRPTEPVLRVGNASRARAELGWAPSCSFEQLVTLLVDAARAALEAETAK
jgi:GDPmannose 4,6-dehydratase